jgi:hypothetical protein
MLPLRQPAPFVWIRTEGKVISDDEKCFYERYSQTKLRAGI